MTTLEYYAYDGSHMIFTKYKITEEGVIINVDTKKVKSHYTNDDGYNRVSVRDDDGTPRSILIGRALASTFIGKPPTTEHTADHIDRNRLNDTKANIRWLHKEGQADNQTRPAELNSAFTITREDDNGNYEEHTAKEWVEVLKDERTRLGRKYTANCISHYARDKLYGFRYKTFQNLPREVWKVVKGSKNNKGGEWQISSRGRVKYVTSYAENVLTATQLHKSGGYPVIRINGVRKKCHEISFMTFSPKRYACRKKGDVIMHIEDNKLDFRPHKLCLGSKGDNGTSAHDNGSYDGTQKARKTCISYINDVFEKEHASIIDAVRYLRENDYPRAVISNISISIRDNLKRYNRTWKTI